MAVYPTIVDPSGKDAPGKQDVWNDISEQLSVATGGVQLTGVIVPVWATVIFEGQPVITGLVVSASQTLTTVTTNTQVDLLPFLSDA